MAATQQVQTENLLEVYDGLNFVGKKYTFYQGASNVSPLQLNIGQISIKVIGSGKWKLYSDTELVGYSYELISGDYASFLENPDAMELNTVKSLSAEWDSPDSGPNYPYGHQYVDQWAALGAWFLGTKAENIDIFNELAQLAFQGNGDFRQSYFPTDPNYITRSVTDTKAYRAEIKNLKTHLDAMIERMKNSTPITSIRFQGHMNWDCTMPSNLGYLAALLYNQNNVANEASPVTTLMEIEVGDQLCQMLGYPEKDTSDPSPWGHITADGSIANIEALWSSRNVKLYPLTVKRALENDPLLKNAAGYQVFVPSLGTKVEMVTLDQWQLLNLDLDDIIRMPQEVSDLAGVPPDVYTKAVDKNNLANLGWLKFNEMYNLSKIPVVAAPRSMHYSWPKAASLLGIGQDNLRRIPFDVNARIDLQELAKILEDCLKEQIPVISVVAVIGTTEESAVDPLSDIVNLRRAFRQKGLNFIINADGAWGGYFTTMLHKEPVTASRFSVMSSDIPYFPLSPYTRTQLLSLKYADTITVDPHKSGFCPYPAGGLCYRNGAMRSFVKLEADVVFHHLKSPSVGIWGIEGSKPGAAPAGVLLSHMVIGLDQLGYGRILGQCTLGGKLFYCYWLTLAKDDDNFVCVPMKPLPDNYTLEEAKTFIRENILGKDNDKLMKNPSVFKFLEEIGPDTLINAFAVNMKGNQSVEFANQLNMEVFQRLSHTSDLQDMKRIPLILTQSNLSADDYDKACRSFKERLGLNTDTPEGVNFLINTVMNPWVSTSDKIHIVTKAFRQTVLDSIGKLTDPHVKHGFVLAGKIRTENGVVFGDHLPMFTYAPHQYQAIAKFQVVDETAIQLIKEKQEEQALLPQSKRQPVVIGNRDDSDLDTFLKKAKKEKQPMDCFVGNPSSSSVPFLTTDVKVLDIPRCQHFDMTSKAYPSKMTYFLYGDKNGAYLSHDMTMQPDFQQVVHLDAKPPHVTNELLELGIDVDIPSMAGNPVFVNDQMMDPLTDNHYVIEFVSYNGELESSPMSLENDGSRVWFNPLNM